MRNWSRQSLSPRWLLPVLALAACSQTVTPDSTGGVDVQFQIDIQKNLDGGLGQDGNLTDAPVDQGAQQPDGKSDAPDEQADDADAFADADSQADETTGSVNGQCEFPADPQEGEPGAACESANDCNNGYCVSAANGKVCSQLCYDCCPTGFACHAWGSNSGTLVCQAVGLELCRPCKKDAECAANGIGALCVHYGETGSFCGSACADDSDCSAGYACKLSNGEKGAAKQCVLAQGECPCSAAAIQAGASTTCQNSNTFGTCSGERACGSSGLSPCPATAPAQEACGDGQDNNCNGKTDEIGAMGCALLFVDGDKDGDGKLSSPGQCLCAPAELYTASTATDCDDKSAAINGQATETCDGLDNNCNGQTDEGCDSDGDLFCNAAMAMVGTPAICPKGGGDCNDGDVGIHPDQLEICGNLKDDDCDGLTDSGASTTGCVPFYPDGDGDGYGTGTPVCQCGVKPGYTASKGGDCDDGNAAIHPGTAEVCNGADDNCDDVVDEAGAIGCAALFADLDGDGWGVGASLCLCGPDKGHSAFKAGDCDDAAVAISPGATETCNGKDDNCDGVTDEMGAAGCATYYLDKDGDTFGDATTGICLCKPNPLASTQDGTDCNDDVAVAHPGATEICDGVDNDCDGLTDEANASGCTNFFVDGDGDGFGTAAKVACLCAASAEFSVAKAGDCQDGNAAIHPGAVEICDGVDNNCVNGLDEQDATGCTDFARDHDGDGFGAIKDVQCLCAKTGEYTSTLATDCNDNDKSIHPKALEICDGADNDCDGVTDPAGSDGCNNWFVDKDADGFGNYGAPSKCLCDAGIGFAAIGGDCNDAAPAINPDATEICNGKDDNCDGNVDPANTSGCTVFYADGDGDGYGTSNLLQCACLADGLFKATQGGDCKDGDPAINPGATEVCNSADDNCNSQIDEGLLKAWYVDADKDSYGTGGAKFGCVATGTYTASQSGDCDDAVGTTFPGAPELCNGVDDNCNGQIDEGGSATKYFLDNDGDGYGIGGGQILCGTSGGYTALVGGDCDDTNGAIHPTAAESCNGKDDDCNGLIDDGLPTGQYYKDFDGDGYGSGMAIAACSGTGYASLNGDCNDTSAAIHPNAKEACDGLDNDCNGSVDDGLSVSTFYPDNDKDGYGVGGGASACGPLGSNTATKSGDCDDANATVNPGANEGCGNGVDDNCNGAVDEGCVVACSPAVVNGLNSAADTTLMSSDGNGNAWHVSGEYTPHEGLKALIWEDTGGCGYWKSDGTKLAKWQITVPSGATQILADIIFDNRFDDVGIFFSNYVADTGVKMTVTLDGAPVVLGPYGSWQDTWKTISWPATPAMWGKSLEMTASVVAPASNYICSGGFLVDNVRSGCN